MQENLSWKIKCFLLNNMLTRAQRKLETWKRWNNTMPERSCQSRHLWWTLLSQVTKWKLWLMHISKPKPDLSSTLPGPTWPFSLFCKLWRDYFSNNVSSPSMPCSVFTYRSFLDITLVRIAVCVFLLISYVRQPQQCTEQSLIIYFTRLLFINSSSARSSNIYQKPTMVCSDMFIDSSNPESQLSRIILLMIRYRGE